MLSGMDGLLEGVALRSILFLFLGFVEDPSSSVSSQTTVGCLQTITQTCKDYKHYKCIVFHVIFGLKIFQIR